MKVIIISKYSLIREGISSIISKQKDILIQFVGQTVKEAVNLIKNNIADVVLLDICKGNKEELNLITDIRDSGSTAKFIILDFYGDNEIFVKALKNGVQGYILGNSSETEMLHAIEQVYTGKKYYDSYFVDHMINEKENFKADLKVLTAREKQILMEVAKGENNKKIAEKFLITEHTVKKHINHIFNKLNLSNRTEIALYVNKCEMLNK
ncbi:response regulator transcription factor [Clostridium sp. PL3]|uniref:Response regulator transcription factor n=1 Tax=Clostridium thailandense TaxID=2794346 RepID=A0A949TSK5_9CLOT|nr:response regulator transcription factor [Clostridium thailandense]MBV7271538.1 response regulator transcription factor [Clostridium thailandense]